MKNALDSIVECVYASDLEDAVRKARQALIEAIDVGVVNCRFVKPLDEGLLRDLADRLGVAEFFPWDSDEGLLDAVLEMIPHVRVGYAGVQRDEETAITATTRLLKLARETGRRVHVLHVTTAEEMALLAGRPRAAHPGAAPRSCRIAGHRPWCPQAACPRS